LPSLLRSPRRAFAKPEAQQTNEAALTERVGRVRLPGVLRIDGRVDLARRERGMGVGLERFSTPSRSIPSP
jgi:hypothetical protein